MSLLFPWWEFSRESKKFYSLGKHLFAKFEWGHGDEKEHLTLMNVHLKATPESVEIRKKQLKLVRKWLEKEIAAGENVIVIGDFNTEEFAKAPRADSDVGMFQIGDRSTKSDDLFDLHLRLEHDQRNTHMIHREFDHLFVSKSVIDDTPRRKDLVFKSIRNYKNLVVRGKQDKDHRDIFYKIPEKERDISDHYPIQATF